jgi:D-alanyl-D-alanine carboxypeptidase
MILFIASIGLARTSQLDAAHLSDISNISSGNILSEGIPTSSELKPILSPIASNTPATSTKPAVTPVRSNPADDITAQSYIVGNAATGQIYLSKNINLVNGIASISKLFTAIIVKENMSLSQEVEITQPMINVYPDSYGIEQGEELSVSDLLYAMLLQSNNNVAEGLAMAYSSPMTYASSTPGSVPTETSFIDKMNVFAASIGLRLTHFQDASGLAPGNISDAADLFTFAQYLYHNEQDILAITRTPSFSVATGTSNLGHNFMNIDPFVGDPHLIGGKTGRTDDAGETMISIFDYQSKGKDYPIVVIVLHSALLQRQVDSSKLYAKAISLITTNG